MSQNRGRGASEGAVPHCPARSSRPRSGLTTSLFFYYLASSFLPLSAYGGVGTTSGELLLLAGDARQSALAGLGAAAVPDAASR